VRVHLLSSTLLSTTPPTPPTMASAHSSVTTPSFMSKSATWVAAGGAGPGGKGEAWHPACAPCGELLQHILQKGPIACTQLHWSCTLAAAECAAAMGHIHIGKNGKLWFKTLVLGMAWCNLVLPGQEAERSMHTHQLNTGPGSYNGRACQAGGGKAGV